MSDGYGVTVFPLYKHFSGMATWDEIRENARQNIRDREKREKKEKTDKAKSDLNPLCQRCSCPKTKHIGLDNRCSTPGCICINRLYSLHVIGAPKQEQERVSQKPVPPAPVLCNPPFSKGQRVAYLPGYDYELFYPGKVLDYRYCSGRVHNSDRHQYLIEPEPADGSRRWMPLSLIADVSGKRCQFRYEKLTEKQCRSKLE